MNYIVYIGKQNTPKKNSEKLKEIKKSISESGLIKECDTCTYIEDSAREGIEIHTLVEEAFGELRPSELKERMVNLFADSKHCHNDKDILKYAEAAYKYITK